MKFTSLLLSAALLFSLTACGSDYDEDYYDEGYYDETAYYQAENSPEGMAYPAEAGGPAAGDYQAVSTNPQRAVDRGGNDRIMHSILDAQTGAETGRIPLPRAWKVSANTWTGPGQTRVEGRKGGSFSSQQRRVSSIDQILREDVLPYLQQHAQVLGTIDLPEVARNDQQLYAQYWKVMPTQEYHAAKGVELRDQQGLRGLVIVHFTLSRSQYGDFANYYMHILSADEANYARAKADLIFGLAHREDNPQFVAAHNQREQQKSQANWSAHNSRMQAKQRNFDSFQQTQRTLSEVGDIYHEGYMNRSRMNDAGHDRSVDGIWEQQNATNPYSGQVGKVESGYKYYYMNQFGEYIGTNDEFYNPAMDPRLNNQEWQRVQNQGGY